MGNYGRWAEEVGSGEVRSTTDLRLATQKFAPVAKQVSDSEICSRGQAPQNKEHVLQTCTSHRQNKSQNVAKPHSSGEETLWHNGKTCPDSGLHCSIGSHCLTDSCRKKKKKKKLYSKQSPIMEISNTFPNPRPV